jgi:hypothetical protein
MHRPVASGFLSAGNEPPGAVVDIRMQAAVENRVTYKTGDIRPERM